MADSDPKPDEEDKEKLLAAWVSFTRGKATPEEDKLIDQAFKNPHSMLHDWLESLTDQIEAETGEKASHTQAADSMIEEAVARKHREDVIAFLRRKYAEGKFSQAELAKLIVAGALDAEQAESPLLQQYSRAANRMLQLAVNLQPSLSREIAALTQSRGTDRDGRSR